MTGQRLLRLIAVVRRLARQAARIEIALACVACGRGVALHEIATAAGVSLRPAGAPCRMPMDC